MAKSNIKMIARGTNIDLYVSGQLAFSGDRETALRLASGFSKALQDTEKHKKATVAVKDMPGDDGKRVAVASKGHGAENVKRKRRPIPVYATTADRRRSWEDGSQVRKVRGKGWSKSDGVQYSEDARIRLMQEQANARAKQAEFDRTAVEHARAKREAESAKALEERRIFGTPAQRKLALDIAELEWQDWFRANRRTNFEIFGTPAQRKPDGLMAYI